MLYETRLNAFARLTVCGMACALSACTAYDRDQYAALVDTAAPIDVPGDSNASDTRDATCASRVVADYCAQMPALDTPPLIDGVLDCGLTLEPLSPSRNWSEAIPPPSTLQIEFATAWRVDGLYAFVHVTTPFRTLSMPGYCGDAVELFFDSDGMFGTIGLFDEPGTRQFIIGAPPSGIDRVVYGEISSAGTSPVPWTSSNFVAVATSDGYAVEAFISPRDLGLASLSLAPGNRVGFDVEVDVGPRGPTDASACTVFLGQTALNVASPITGCPDGRASCNSSAFCTPMLLSP